MMISRKVVSRNKSNLILHCNGGPAYLENIMEAMKRIKIEYKPAVLAVSEANLRWKQIIKLVNMKIIHYWM